MHQITLGVMGFGGVRGSSKEEDFVVSLLEETEIVSQSVYNRTVIVYGLSSERLII